MRVLVTGATGFVGSHACAALDAAGHDVRVLARTPRRVPEALEPFGVEPEVVVGDMTDPERVAAAVAGCDALIHAAAQSSFGGADQGRAADVNLAGTRTVVGAAIDAGVRRIVHISSTVVHLPTDAPVITVDTPLAEATSPYAASKIEAERLVRRWQDDGHPVTTVVLGGVFGPQTLDLVNGFTAVISALEQMMIVPPGGSTVIDVRDVATLLVRIVESESDPGPRVLAGGHYLDWERWVATLEEAASQDVVRVPVTVDALHDMVHDLAVAARRTGEPPLLSEEAATIMVGARPVDDAASLRRFGVRLRPAVETMADTVSFLRTSGALR